MKLANIENRAHILTEIGGVDIAAVSNGRFPSDIQQLLGRISELRSWLKNQPLELDPTLSCQHLQESLPVLGPPVPAPGQLFAIGLNYRAHGDEVGMKPPEEPMVFTKFQSAIAGPGAKVELPSDTVDWEVELVVVIGLGGRHINAENALAHVAGYCVGQDLSERTLQLASTPPQFSVAKSFQAFAPIGPWLTTADEIDVGELQLQCRVGDEILQDGTTRDMIFSVPTLISYLSKICELRVGDLIFSGTPDGVGMGCNPPRYIRDGWLLESHITGLGRIANLCRKLC